MISTSFTGWLFASHESTLSAGGQSEHPSEVKSSTTTGVRPARPTLCEDLISVSPEANSPVGEPIQVTTDNPTKHEILVMWWRFISMFPFAHLLFRAKPDETEPTRN